MSLEVAVHVNRDEPHHLETDVATVETCESFSIVVHGHETPAHVHCRLDDRLDRVASIDASNYYIEPGAVTQIPIGVDPRGLDDPIEGRLDIVTGYGTESITIDVTVRPEPQRIPVDTSLAEPTAEDAASDGNPPTGPVPAWLSNLDPGTALIGALAVLSIGLGIATAAMVGGAVALGALAIVTGGVAVALWMLLS